MQFWTHSKFESSRHVYNIKQNIIDSLLGKSSGNLPQNVLIGFNLAWRGYNARLDFPVKIEIVNGNTRHN